MILVELKGLSYQYGTSIYAVDRVNGTMYGKFSVGYRIIHEKATVIPQFKQTPLEDEYNTMQPTSMVAPIMKSTPVTQASQLPTLPIVSPSERDILEPSSNEQARAAYLKGRCEVCVVLGCHQTCLLWRICHLDPKTCQKEYKIFVKNGRIKGI